MHVDLLQLDCLPTEAGKNQQRINEPSDPQRLRTDQAEHPAAVVIEPFGVFFDQYAGKAVHRAQRCSQVV